MPKSLFATYLIASVVDVSLALQVQPQTPLANLRNDQGGRSGRTTELEWVWTEVGETCDDACNNKCPGAECSELDRVEIDTCDKITDLEAEMGTSVCGDCTTGAGWGPYVYHDPNDGVGYCYHSDTVTQSCTDTTPEDYQFLCACEVTLGTCTIAGDPHINVFDDAQISLHREHQTSLNMVEGTQAVSSDDSVGDRWLVKSERVSIQARFQNVTNDYSHDIQLFTRAIGLGGDILGGNVLVVGSLDDPITWNGHPILKDQESDFAMKGNSFSIEATRGMAKLVEDPTQENLGVTIKLSSSVSLIVNRLHHSINAAITMPHQNGGQDGMCGNFNGVGSDDAYEMMNDRFNPVVSSDESLFAGLSFQ